MLTRVDTKASLPARSSALDLERLLQVASLLDLESGRVVLGRPGQSLTAECVTSLLGSDTMIFLLRNSL